MANRAVTMEDVAARAGVSRALVSIVFRGAPGAAESTRQRVLAAARELDYQPDTRASRLGRSRTRTRTLGVVFGVGHDFHGDVIDAIYASAGPADYEVVLSGVTRHRSEDVAVRTLLAEKCEALLLLGSGLPAKEMVRLAVTVPVVSLLRPVRAAGVDVVRTDDAGGLAQAVAHLGELGHRRIAHLDGGRNAGAAERRRGFRTAVRRLGVEAEGVELAGGLTEEDGAAAALELLALPGPRPTAVTAFNDRCALGVMDVVRRHGVRVPEDLSVVGFDDIEQAAYRHVSLTTIRQDVEALGAAAIERVRARLDAGDESTRDVVVPPTLVARESTARLDIGP
ncbi:LacI family transcriptional regulator [Intrasporangium oryzae NRRL B-24470]|uniref:LacI family transcriptional regulator n=1 Tax=Intrasporangium oryzae NRRL B-24470 TaxID=1386089 RepID=W9GE93_9MICO|nr:LacI family DNA-binding transcriptional regulator [Intrasporangium oryzae]EWT02194.1 LacI family transcriptional regulator [Intrasporangium oryzae NRRL B-24470]